MSVIVSTIAEDTYRGNTVELSDIKRCGHTKVENDLCPRKTLVKLSTYLDRLSLIIAVLLGWGAI